MQNTKNLDETIEAFGGAFKLTVALQQRIRQMYYDDDFMRKIDRSHYRCYDRAVEEVETTIEHGRNEGVVTPPASAPEKN